MNMKKEFGLCLLLFVILIGSSSLASFTNRFSVAKAAYVMGNITQDTIWTLVDSPFVVYQNVVVFPNATLTIEPGVQVQFGGPFSIVIEGKMIADGTTKEITFTSNAENPLPGDWDGIVFSGQNQSSLTRCLLAYAENGITTTNANVKIDKCDVKLCNQTGISATNSQLTITNSNVSDCAKDGINATSCNLTVENSAILDNNGNGIQIAGNGQFIIQQDTLIGNDNGTLLTGNIVSGVNINQNLISANKQSGISIQAATYNNVIILKNTISSNNYGVYISTSASTTITNNSLSYNNYGFYYNVGSHSAKFNDIYMNAMGIDVGPLNLGPINAQQNYWGARNGPYHPLLNPEGQGNSVGGSGVTIDFIPFLTSPTNHINTPPVAILQSDKSTVSTNQEVMFFATNSHDDGSINWYKFDFGDNRTSGWTALSVFTHKYSSPSLRLAKLTVMDDFGATNQTELNISVQTGLNPILVVVNANSSDLTAREDAYVAVTVIVTDSLGTAIEDATVTLFSVNGGQFTQTTGTTNSSGCFGTIFTMSGMARPSNIRIVATASKNPYADGSGYLNLRGIPGLLIQLLASQKVTSTESTPINVEVTSNGSAISNAVVTIETTYGNLSSEEGITDINGNLLTTFTAPQTIVPINATLSASATKTGYNDGSTQMVLIVEPKIPKVSISALPLAIYSGDQVNLTMNVEYSGTPLWGANVTVSVTQGNLTKTNGLTDDHGNTQLLLESPLVSNDTTVTISTSATAAGYANCQNQTTITVSPRTFNIKIKPEPLTLISADERSMITVNVTCKQDSLPVQGARILISTTHGSLSNSSGTTDGKGLLTLFLYPPEAVVAEIANITVSVTKNGYTEATNRTSVTINIAPSPQTKGGISILELLMIIVPIAIVIVFVVLVKKKIIRFSANDEEAVQ
jgi:parallel beta-helix repeat protein